MLLLLLQCTAHTHAGYLPTHIASVSSSFNQRTRDRQCLCFGWAISRSLTTAAAHISDAGGHSKGKPLGSLPPIYQFPYCWSMNGRMQSAKREKRFQEDVHYLLELFPSFTGSTNWKLIYARAHTRFVRFRVDLLISKTRQHWWSECISDSGEN